MRLTGFAAQQYVQQLKNPVKKQQQSPFSLINTGSANSIQTYSVDDRVQIIKASSINAYRNLWDKLPDDDLAQHRSFDDLLNSLGELISINDGCKIWSIIIEHDQPAEEEVDYFEKLAESILSRSDLEKYLFEKFSGASKTKDPHDTSFGADPLYENSSQSSSQYIDMHNYLCNQK